MPSATEFHDYLMVVVLACIPPLIKFQGGYVSLDSMATSLHYI